MVSILNYITNLLDGLYYLIIVQDAVQRQRNTLAMGYALPVIRLNDLAGILLLQMIVNKVFDSFDTNFLVKDFSI
jgi:hypothetical protein